MNRVDPFGLIGTVLEARYRIESVVGEGGFGVVYRATQVSFEEPVAVKVLKLGNHITAEQRDNVIATFSAEGKHLRKLSAEHPAFVKALDTGVVEVRGQLTPYLVLEWLDGEPLADDLQRRRNAGEKGRSLAECMACLAPVVSALSHAHEQRVAHRDVKPANIFALRTKGEPALKLLDFGMAKVMTETGTEAFDTPTQGGIIGLSPRYAAPEQWKKTLASTGPWTDVYALALILVEMLTDGPALVGGDLPQFLAATFDSERPTPLARGAQVSPEVEAVFVKALAIAPQERYRTARAFWDALETAASGASREGAAAPAAALAPSPSKAATSPVEPSPTAQATSSVPAATMVDDDRSSRSVGPPAAEKAGRAPMVRVATLGLIAGLLIGATALWLSRSAGGTPPLPVAAAPGPSALESATAPTATATKPRKPKPPRWWDEPLDKPTNAPAPQLPPAKQRWIQLYRRATTLQSEEKYADAESSLRQAREVACKQLGQSDAACLETLQKLARLLFGMGKLDEAEKTLREAVEVVDKYGDPEEEGFDDTRQVLIMVLVKQGKTDEASRLLKEGEEALVPSVPDAPAPDAAAPDASAPDAAAQDASAPDASTPRTSAPLKRPRPQDEDPFGGRR